MLPAIAIIIFMLLLTIWVYARTQGHSLRVLMYHRVTLQESNRLTVTAAQLAQQLQWLLKKNYSIISFTDLKKMEQEGKMPKGSYVILSFDDAYKNNLTHAVPLLTKYNCKATIFIPTAYIGKSNAWDDSKDAIMTAAQLRTLPANTIELALHTHTHKNFKHCPINDIETEMQQSMDTLQQLDIPYVPVLAYAYGGYPKDKTKQQQLFTILKNMGIWYALRIGNGINRLPMQQPYLIKRIDVRGTDSFFAFKLKLLLGKIKL
jgi:peptidoglycan/xylan/chitin deacetylase (PgdA/CDA1 family)